MRSFHPVNAVRGHRALSLLTLYVVLLLQLPEAHVVAAESADACPCPPADCQCPLPPSGEGVCLTAVGCHGQGALQVWQLTAFPEHMGATLVGTAPAEAATSRLVWKDPAATSVHTDLPAKVPR